MKQYKAIAIFISICLFADIFYGIDIQAASLKLNKKSIVVKERNSVTIKVKNTKKKAKWSIKSGKKYIRLKAKKRVSVKVVGVKKGTAKVQCKVGRKKLICKVKVTKKVKKKPTVSQPPVTVSPVPTAVPTESPVVTQTPRPSHIPTEDRLMAEPRKEVEEDPNREPTGGEFWWPQWDYYFYGSHIKRSKIEKVTIANSAKIPEGVLGFMDLSERQNGSVMAWYVDDDGDGYYEMTIGQDGGVVANPDSSCMFYEISFWGTEENPICGLENLYTSEVKNMSYMFACINVTGGSLRAFSLGDWFDTSQVEDMSGMFASFGCVSLKELRLGKQFNVSKVTDAVLMFFYCGLHSSLGEIRCYVNSEELKQWILDDNNHIGRKYSILYKPERIIVKN